jgi:flagellar basal body-associated protein FliL
MSDTQIFIIVLIVIILLVGAGLGIHYFANKVDYTAHKIDDATKYETIKKVEDTCRSMISSYESDKLVYEQYKDSDNPDHVNWADQAKMRANKTAVTYNNYILKNSFVWSGNIPSDIKTELEVLR